VCREVFIDGIYGSEFSFHSSIARSCKDTMGVLDGHIQETLSESIMIYSIRHPGIITTFILNDTPN
jgi:hypothetical protein